jgi:hypothetical protein
MNALQLLRQRPVNELDVYADLRYDYSRVEDETVRERLRQAAVQIKPRLKRAAEDLFVIGQELVTIKEYLGHGEWGEWLATEFGLSDRMARNFMNVAIRLGGKTEKFSVLPVSVLYELAAPSTAPEVIEQVEGEIETGAVPSLTDIRTWKEVQRQQRVQILTAAIDDWVAQEAAEEEEAIQLLSALQAETTEVPAAVQSAIIEPTPKEIGLAIAQSLAQRLSQHAPEEQAVTDNEMPKKALDTNLRRALSLLEDENQCIAYARLTNDDPHLAEAIDALQKALAALAQ